MMKRSWILLPAVCLLAIAGVAQVPKDRLVLGGNVNERFHWATPQILEQTHATWVRGFIPASEFIEGKRSYDNDEGLRALKVAASSGHKVVLSIKWDSAGKGNFGRMPRPGSPAEAKAFAFLDRLLDATTGQVAVLAIINELPIDTLPEDLQPDASGKIPVITFLQRVAEHVDAEHRKASDGSTLPIFAGGMTRMDQPKQQALPAYIAMIRWVNDDARIAGCDYHLHQPDMATTEQALEYMHKAVPAKALMVTEFSLVWKWERHFDDPVDASAAGKVFAKKYDIPAGTTAKQFVGAAMVHPVPEAEWQQFLLAQPWFEPHYLSDVAKRMQANGVKIATYALTWDPLKRVTATSSQGHTEVPKVPWFLNQLLVPTMAVSPDPARLPENAGFFADFVSYQAPANGSSGH